MDPDVEGVPQGDEIVRGELEQIGFGRIHRGRAHHSGIGKHINDLGHARITEAPRLVPEALVCVRQVPIYQSALRFHARLTAVERDILVEVVIGKQMVPAGTHGHFRRPIKIDLWIGFAALARPLAVLGDQIRIRFETILGQLEQRAEVLFEAAIAHVC